MQSIVKNCIAISSESLLSESGTMDISGVLLSLTNWTHLIVFAPSALWLMVGSPGTTANWFD